MKNHFFNIVKINIDEPEIIDCIHINTDTNIWESICKNNFDNAEYAEEWHKDPYNAMYKKDLKEYIYNDFPDIYNILSNSTSLLGENLNSKDIEVWLGSTNDYRKFNDKFDNDMKFIEYITSEIAERDKNTLISSSILKEAGFENTTDSNEAKFWQTSEYFIKDFSSWRRDTYDVDGNNYIIINIKKGVVNSSRTWGIQIDNHLCEGIGSIEIDNVWQFNTFMKLLGTKFRLQ